MFDNGSIQQWVRVGVIGLALFGIVWLLLQFNPPDTSLSAWIANASVNQIGLSGAAKGLSGMALPQSRRSGAALRPYGNPLRARTLMVTQGYGVGTHAPAATWGGIDLALDSNGDGEAEPEGTLGIPVYATMDGQVKLTPNSWPGGNHIWVVNDDYRTGFAHLLDFAVPNGAMVVPGQLIGHVGSTGSSSGPHLHYDVWQRQNGQWVNLNPLDFGVLTFVEWR